MKLMVDTELSLSTSTRYRVHLASSSLFHLRTGRVQCACIQKFLQLFGGTGINGGPSHLEGLTHYLSALSDDLQPDILPASAITCISSTFNDWMDSIPMDPSCYASAGWLCLNNLDLRN